MSDPVYVGKGLHATGDLGPLPGNFDTVTIPNPGEAGDLVLLWSFMDTDGGSFGNHSNTIDAVSSDGAATGVFGPGNYILRLRYWLSAPSGSDISADTFGPGKYVFFAQAFSHEGGFDDLVFKDNSATYSGDGASLLLSDSRAVASPSGGYQHGLACVAAACGFSVGGAVADHTGDGDDVWGGQGAGGIWSAGTGFVLTADATVTADWSTGVTGATVAASAIFAGFTALTHAGNQSPDPVELRLPDRHVDVKELPHQVHRLLGGRILE